MSDGKTPRYISILGGLARRALQQFVALDVVATACIVDAFGTQIFRIARPIPGTSLKQPEPFGPLQQHLPG